MLVRDEQSEGGRPDRKKYTLQITDNYLNDEEELEMKPAESMIVHQNEYENDGNGGESSPQEHNLEDILNKINETNPHKVIVRGQ